MVSLPLLVHQRTASGSALPRHDLHDTSHDTPIVASHIRTRDLCWSGACLRIEHDAPFDESRTVESLALTQVTKASLTKPTPSHQWIFRYQNPIVPSSSSFCASWSARPRGPRFLQQRSQLPH